jgi:hypothetical protein
VMPDKRAGDGGNGAQTHILPDAVCAKKKSYQPAHQAGALLRVELRKCKNYEYQPQQTEGSMQWIPAQIVGIDEDFHSQVNNGKAKTTLYNFFWQGHDRRMIRDSPQHNSLQVYATMVKVFKESHQKHL